MFQYKTELLLILITQLRNYLFVIICQPQCYSERHAYIKEYLRENTDYFYRVDAFHNATWLNSFTEKK